MSPATQARLRAGYTIEAAAKKLKRSPRYVRQVELHGGASDQFCQRASRLFQCNADYFFHGPNYWNQLQEAEAVVSASTPFLARRPGLTEKSAGRR